MPVTITMMKKVGLDVTDCSKKEGERRIGSPAKLDFIYGVASDGLTSFELALNGKGEGDRLIVNISVLEGQRYFGHLFSPVVQALGWQILPETLHLEIAVTSIADADHREIVRSIAESVAQCGCGGSCGCGC